MDNTEKLMLEVIKLAIENPNKIYQRPVDGDRMNTMCSYTKDKGGSIPGVNGCLFGLALMRLWPEYANKLIDVDNSIGLYSKGISMVWQYLNNNPIETDKCHIFSEVQNAQDGGNTWSDAILNFSEHIRKEFQSNPEILNALDVLSTKK